MSKEVQIQEGWSGPRKFYEKVRLMRNAQKVYFQTRTTSALEQAKVWENEVDRIIEETEHMNRTQQQAMRALGRTIQNAASQVYALGGGASNANLRGAGISPKEYGLWLAQSGKNKHNNRRNKHYKKMRSW